MRDPVLYRLVLPVAVVGSVVVTNAASLTGEPWWTAVMLCPFLGVATVRGTAPWLGPQRR